MTTNAEFQLAAYREVLRGIAAGDGDEPGSEAAAREVLAKYQDEEPPATTDRAMELVDNIKNSANAIGLFMADVPDELFDTVIKRQGVSPLVSESRDLVAGLIEAAIKLADALGIPATIYAEEDKVQVYYTIEKVVPSAPYGAPVIELGEVACTG